MYFFNTIKLPAPASSDQTTWRVYGITNGQPQGFRDYPVATTEVEYPWSGGMPIEGVGVPVQIRLKAVDGSGNESEESVLDYVTADTFPPPKPGPMEVVGGRQA